MKILFFGDIIGKIGRKAIKKNLPELKKEFKPDLIIANVENLAHGIGVTKKTLQELTESGIDFFTSGNHIFKKPEAKIILNEKNSNLIRPANYPDNHPGNGAKIFEIGSKSVLIINLIGRVFMKDQVGCPFKKIDQILERFDLTKISAIIIDFHAEATSEKQALGWYVNGRVSALFGTHTHVPTADSKILNNGTAFITDVGMVGAFESVIGDKIEPIVKSFLTETNPKIEIPKEGLVQINAVLAEIDGKTKKAVNLKRVDKIIKV